ncbi:MAG TPA: formate--phosphoribosylaminoimidazolecarboxamide ligase, partial [Thermoprotei archaeon]|nr:formate--phosphoribosylaminoimidazolecarboxamide ligase [Thermoprotei archaeon]
MISKEEINEILNRYREVKIATICSHSALQIFHGARLEGFKTIGISLKDRVRVYESFPLARPDEFLIVSSFKEILDEDIQEYLREKNCIVIPHGSFIAYIGGENILNKLYIPMFGNRLSLLWECNRDRQREWLRKAGLTIPRRFNEIHDRNTKVFVKFHGAMGGKNYFVTDMDKIEEELERRGLSLDDVVVEEFISGVRYYPHYFYSLLLDRLELLSMDRRIETIDESYRFIEKIYDYTVSGNIPVIVRESFLKSIISMGESVVNVSKKLFPPGIIGPFCLESFFNPSKGFIVFEISARIVAGTNLYPMGSFYS